MRQSLLFLCTAAAVGCGAKAPIESSEAALTRTSNPFAISSSVVGSLDYGQTSAATKYTSSPTYRLFKFAGNEGDQIVVDVRAQNGDTVAWVLDNDFTTLASNDDYQGTNSHIELTLPASASATHYIAVRDYYYAKMTFTVALRGQVKPGADLYACQTDADCVRVNAGCCPLGHFAAVNSAQTDAYRATLGCSTPQICPAIAFIDDHSVAQCQQNKCVVVKPADIACGGRSLNPHSCPAGFQCTGAALLVDGTGTCQQTCGGFAGRGCDNGQVCVDDPNDSCDPAHGGADCGGICRPACGVQTELCMVGHRWDATQCSCVENDHCGGIAGLACPTGKTCVDDPSDSCDPAQGGADCSGICVAQTDCRTSGCSAGHFCSYCWGSFACIPDGALC